MKWFILMMVIVSALVDNIMSNSVSNNIYRTNVKGFGKNCWERLGWNNSELLFSPNLAYAIVSEWPNDKSHYVFDTRRKSRSFIREEPI